MSPDQSRELVLPCFKERQWPGREHTVSRVLWAAQASAYMPWVAVGYDRPHTFEFINTSELGAMNTTAEALEAEAVANLCRRAAKWDVIDLDLHGKPLRMLTGMGDYFSAEHLLDAAFMRQAQQTLGARGLIVGIPRRSVMMAIDGELDSELVAGFGVLVANEFQKGESAVISPMLFAVKDGAIVGIVEAVADALSAADTTGEVEEPSADDETDAASITAVTLANDRGTEDVHRLRTARTAGSSRRRSKACSCRRCTSTPAARSSAATSRSSCSLPFPLPSATTSRR